MIKAATVALVVDVVLFAAAVVPSMIGYVGSEHWEWTSLAIAVVTGIGGLALSLLLAGLLFARRRRRSP